MGAQPQGTPSDRAGPAPTGASDVELLAAIAAGSEPAFEELRRRYRRAVRGVCRAVAGWEREDCEQEVFSRIWTKASLFDPARGSAAAWLLTLSRRTALNLRGGRRQPAPTDHEPEDASPPVEVDAFWLGAALARLGERQSLLWFRQTLTSEDPHRVHETIQTIAVESLTLLWPDLDRVADADDPDVAHHAREALERMSEEMESRRK